MGFPQAKRPFDRTVNTIPWPCKLSSNTSIYRHGYPIAFMDRQTVLQTLYNKIQDKSKILTGKRVKAIDSSDPTVVKVITTDGSIYSGDIVVGADGIHSTVRQEMARLNVNTGRDYLEEKCELLSYFISPSSLLHSFLYQSAGTTTDTSNSILCNLLLCLRDFTPDSRH